MQEVISYIQKAVLEISNALKFDTGYSQNQIYRRYPTQFDVLSDEIITKL